MTIVKKSVKRISYLAGQCFGLPDRPNYETSFFIYE